jgi:hypothetical protein
MTVRFLIIFAIIAAGTVSISAQVANVSTAAESSPAASVAPAPDVTDGPYTLKQGDNEFGFWAGGSFKATTAFAGLTEAEARDRKFFIAAVRYGRTLWANDSVALQYTLDAIPLAVATGNIRSSTTIGGVTTFQRDTTYGAGATPLGLQLDFANGSKVHPFVHVNGGFLVFTQSMPLPDSGRVALVGEAGTGLRIFTSERRAVTLGFRFHHISNGDRSGSNRGLNQFVFYGGFSIFR